MLVVQPIVKSLIDARIGRRDIDDPCRGGFGTSNWHGAPGAD
jgi:hypothetical protein